MINTNLQEFIEIGKTFNKWFAYIVNSFSKDIRSKRMSNGIIEGSNNKIKVIKNLMDMVIYIILEIESCISLMIMKLHYQYH